MAEYIASQGGQLLNIEAKYYNKLDIEGFSQMMKDPSYSYKFYWLEAIVHIISEGKNETTLEEIIEEMIANAWYSVREFHIHLSGIQADGLIRDGQKLYRKGNSREVFYNILEKNMMPVYDSARRQGYEIWNYG